MSILLVTAVLNTVVTKAVHEFFEHQHETHTCLNKDQTHFHEVEFGHIDLICHFNFSTSFFTDFTTLIDAVLTFYNQLIRIEFYLFSDNLFHYHFLLRGPPIN